MMARLCRLFQWLFAVDLLFVLATAEPTEIQKRRGISLPLKYGINGSPNIRRGERSPSSIIADMKIQLESVKRRYSDGLLLASGPRLRKRLTSGSVTLTDIGYDSNYFALVQVGTPPQSFNITIGTGSADFWVASDLCHNTTISHKFNSQASSTWVNSTKDFLIQHQDGNVTGWIGTDTVSLGDFTIEGQTLGAADCVPGTTLIKDPLSGVMGLGWQALAQISGLPWWQTLMSRGVLQDPLFGTYIARHLLEPGGGRLTPGGSLDFGFANTAYYSGNIKYTNLTGPVWDYWQVPVESLKINGHLIGLDNIIAALDIATPFILGPTKLINAFYAQVPGARPGTGQLTGLWVLPCSNNTNAGLSVTINGVDYSISVVDWIWPFDRTKDLCIGRLGAFEGNRVKWVLGDLFLKNVYTVYRFDPPSVGFAELSDAVRYAGTATTSTSSIPLPTSTSITSGSPRSAPAASAPSSATSSFIGAGCCRPGFPDKAVLSACLSALVWITISPLLW